MKRQSTRGGSWNLDNCTVGRRRQASAPTVKRQARVVPITESKADRLVALEAAWSAAEAGTDVKRELAAKVGALRTALGLNRPVVVDVADHAGRGW